MIKELTDAAKHHAAVVAAQTVSARGGYRLFMEKNIEISRQAGCRVMRFARHQNVLMCSQKSSSGIFPGFGVRFIDLPTFRPNHYIFVSANSVTDLALDCDEALLMATTKEKTCRLYEVLNRSCVQQFTPSDTSAVWSCGFDYARSRILYLGGQNGGVYSYDIRQPATWMKEYKTAADCAPVLHVVAVPATNRLPFGGFLVCKLTSVWFFEYTASEEVLPTKLNVDGPFVSMSYDPQTEHVLLSTRPSQNHPQGRHILANIFKLGENLCSLQVLHTFTGSKVQSQLSRSCQVATRDNIVVAAYMEDSRLLQTWDSKSGQRTQGFEMAEKVLDTCPIYLNTATHLAALTDTKCRVYKFVDD